MSFEKFLRFCLHLIPSRYSSEQSRKPTGWFGRNIITYILSRSNYSLIDFMQSLYKGQKSDVIADIGFGPGILFPMLENKAAKLVGIDFSEDMILLAQKKYKKLIRDGRLELKNASIASLPYPNEYFDAIFSANTIYFWPDPEQNAREVLRVLKPGGKFIVGFATKEQLEKVNPEPDIFKLYSSADVETLLKKAGFSETQSFSKKEPQVGKDSYCVVGRK
ncbi:MAG: class I SAM-dependent methyltransferase [Candidatus Margulisbacteria bacterium]|nr:class I SAM-dependent methyltransferase [Candidatus Margulisiibacteriota bacterium]